MKAHITKMRQMMGIVKIASETEVIWINQSSGLQSNTMICSNFKAIYMKHFKYQTKHHVK